MPICPRCGKTLCNQQSLDNHLRSNACKNANLCQSVKIRNSHDYDFWYTSNFKGIITHIDKESACVLGYTVEEIIGNSGYDTIYEGDKFYVSQFHLSTIINKIPETVIFRRVCKNGNILAVKSSGILNESIGEIVVYEKLITFSDDNNINFILNKDFTYCWISDKFTEVLGYSTKDLLNMKTYDIWTPESLKLFPNAAAQLADKQWFKCIHEVYNKSKQVLRMECSAADRGNFYMVSNRVI